MAATPWRRILFGFALIFCIGPAAAAEPVYPQLSGRIVDDADVLNAADRLVGSCWSTLEMLIC